MPKIQLQVTIHALEELMLLSAAQEEKAYIAECKTAEAGDEDRSCEWENAKNAWDEINSCASALRTAITEAVKPLSKVGIELEGIVPDEDDDILNGIDAMRTAFETLISLAEKADEMAIRAKQVAK